MSVKFTSFIVIALAIFLHLFFLGQYVLLPEEAYYWNYAIHPAFGYLDHPPMVAMLIKSSTWLWGTNEFGVRFPTICGWLLTAYFTYQWSEIVQRGTGMYAILLLAILPFFFLYSLVMTPDLPLMVCWSALLFFLYQALCLMRKHAWYYAGLFLGLGLLSKYSIALLPLATFLYLIITPQARSWFLRKEPYLAIIIALLLFSPVIYWNAAHDWASFAFQSTRRLQTTVHCSLHQLLGLICIFFTPLGLHGLWSLLKKQQNDVLMLDRNSLYFFRLFTFFPLAIFILFSLTHEVKCNWIGPSILSILPWLAVIMYTYQKILYQWLITSACLLLLYIGFLCSLSYGLPHIASQTIMSKYIDWKDLTQQFSAIATKYATTKNQPLFIPLDSYSIASELAFYQSKYALFLHPILGAGFFGYNSLMFDYWSKNTAIQGKKVILIAKQPELLNTTDIQHKTQALSPINVIWGKSPRQHINVKKFYYRVVSIR